MSKTGHPASGGITGTDLAAHLFCTRETISDYIAQGVIVKLSEGHNGRYDPDACRQRVLRHLRDKAAGRSGNSGGDLSSERAALAKEQREGISLKNAISRNEFAPIEMMEKALTDLFGVFRERLLTIPGKLSDALSHRTREEIEPILRDELHETLDELSDPAALLGNHSRNRAGMPRSEGPAEAQPDRMG